LGISCVGCYIFSNILANTAVATNFRVSVKSEEDNISVCENTGKPSIFYTAFYSKPNSYS
jgi:hypothetical protein